jgi:Secretion system C-terminal sorting domain
MMKTTLPAAFILLCLTFLCIPSFAQPPDILWTNAIGGNRSDYGNSVQQTDDGGFIIAGNTLSVGAGLSDVFLVKTNSDGTVLWTQTIGGTDWDEANSVQQTTDSGFIIAGTTSSFGAGGRDIWLIKTDSDGDELWTQTFGGVTNDYGSWVRQTGDGGYIIMGSTSSIDLGGSAAWLIKTDEQGTETWSRVFSQNDWDYGECVVQTEDGGYIVTGHTYSPEDGSSDVLLIRTDSDGIETWSTTFGGTSYDYGWCVQQTIEGGFIISGSTYSFGQGSLDAWLIKTDSDGNEVWNETFGGHEFDNNHSVEQTFDGGYILTGHTQSFGDGSMDMWVIKTDAAGDVRWIETYGGSGYDGGNCVQQTVDGGYVIVGNTASFGDGEFNVWLIRLEGDELSVVERSNFTPSEYQIGEVFPNPFNPSTTISIGLPSPSDLRVSVFNTVGQEIAVLADGQFAQGNQRFTFDATGLSTGIYLVQATVPGKMNQMRKVVYLK